MSQVAEKMSSFLSALEHRPQGGPRWLEDLRSRGAAKFTALGIPTVRDEEWRFTNVAPLAAALKDHPDVVQRYFGQLADFTARSFTALNTAFVHDGAFVHLPEGVVLE